MGTIQNKDFIYFAATFTIFEGLKITAAADMLERLRTADMLELSMVVLISLHVLLHCFLL